MIKAVIDLGTNTFNLLIVELIVGKSPRIIFQDKVGVGLGKGGIIQGLIADDALLRAEACLKSYKKTCEAYNTQSIIAIGTSAIRDAENVSEWLERMYHLYDLRIIPISGDKEAELIFKGVGLSNSLSDSGLIMDIGGGSTEFIHYDNYEIQSKVSLNIGLSRIHQLFTFSDPMSLSDIAKLECFLDENSQDYFKNRQLHSFIGASGTFETFFELVNDRKLLDPFVAQTIPMNEFQEVLNQIMASSFEERNQNPKIIQIRKELAPIAAAKVSWVLKKQSFKEIWVSPCSLKEGALLSDLDEF